jgi:hypothetical protein
MTAEELEQTTQLIKMLAPPVLRAIGKSMGCSVTNVRALFSSTFSEHLAQSKRRCAFVRTIINPDYDTELAEIYVNLYLTHGDQIIRDEDLISKINSYGKIIISGTGGAGKSFLMRHLVLLTMKKDFQQVPIFIELRNLADPRDTSILDSIFKLATPESQRGNRSIFDRALEKNGLCFVLDGLDEVSPELRSELRRQIEDLIVRFPDLKIIISSRPDVDFLGWDRFAIFHIKPLDVNQSIDVIEKICYPNEKIKAEFIEKIKNGQFSKFDSFLQVPLLNAILLMCYGEFLYLSDNTSSFYDQAFEVLYRRHDRTKGLRRKHFSNLDYNQFRSVIGAFCYKTFISHTVSFTEQEFNTFLTKAANISNLSSDSTDLAQDLTESVPLLHRDGLNIFFIHRTFQEYFTSKFMVSYRGSDVYRVYDAALVNVMSTNVAKMAANLDIDGIEREWILPKLQNSINELDKMESTDLHSRLKYFINGFSISAGDNRPATFGGYFWPTGGFMQLTNTLAIIYPDKVIGGQSILLDCSISVEGMPFYEYAISGRGGQYMQERLKNIRDETLDFELELSNEIWDWILKTDLRVRMLKVEKSIRDIFKEVKDRVQQRKAVSIFDD